MKYLNIDLLQKKFIFDAKKKKNRGFKLHSINMEEKKSNSSRIF